MDPMGWFSSSIGSRREPFAHSPIPGSWPENTTCDASRKRKSSFDEPIAKRPCPASSTPASSNPASRFFESLRTSSPINAFRKFFLRRVGTESHTAPLAASLRHSSVTPKSTSGQQTLSSISSRSASPRRILDGHTPRHRRPVEIVEESQSVSQFSNSIGTPQYRKDLSRLGNLRRVGTNPSTSTMNTTPAERKRARQNAYRATVVFTCNTRRLSTLRPLTPDQDESHEGSVSCSVSSDVSRLSFTKASQPSHLLTPPEEDEQSPRRRFPTLIPIELKSQDLTLESMSMPVQQHSETQADPKSDDSDSNSESSVVSPSWTTPRILQEALPANGHQGDALPPASASTELFQGIKSEGGAEKTSNFSSGVHIIKGNDAPLHLATTEDIARVTRARPNGVEIDTQQLKQQGASLAIDRAPAEAERGLDSYVAKLNITDEHFVEKETPKASGHADERLKRLTRAQLRKQQLEQEALNQYEIVPLSAEWDAKVRSAIRHGHGNYASSDLARAVPEYAGRGQDNWLNDEVINGYLSLVTAHGKKNDRPNQTPSFHAFNSFFYTNLSTKGPDSVTRWSKRPKINGTSLLNVEAVFIPINGGAHWTLAVVEPKKRTITHYNSMRSAALGVAACGHIKKWVAKELGNEFHEAEWKIVPAGESPQQTNSDDCGVFTVTSARQIMLGFKPKSYRSDQMETQRKRMVAELINGGLIKSVETLA